MTYASGGLIEAVDYNNFAASVNAIWGAGTGTSGYGQSTIIAGADIAVIGNPVPASSWATLISRLDSLSRHQTGSVTGITQPSAGNVITYLSTITSAISTVTTSKLNAATNSTAVSGNTGANSTGWTTSAVKEVTLTWANAAAMRYYFNCGGFVSFSCDGTNTVLTGNNKSTDWEALITAAGGARINANSSARVNGFVGVVSGSPSVNNTALGFHQLSTAYQVVTRQYSTTATGGYNLNYITYEAKLNAAVGTATVLSVKATLTDAATDVANDTVSGSLTLQWQHTPPEVTYISNTWGAVTVATLTNTQV